MSYLPLNSERITTTHICQGFMYRRWPNRRTCQIESRSRKLATLELPGSFHIYMEDIICLCCVFGNYKKSPCSMLKSKPAVLCSKECYKKIQFFSNFQVFNSARGLYQIIYGTQSQLKLQTYNLQMLVKFSNRTAGLLVGGSKHLQPSLNWLHLQNHRQILAAMLCT